ncbi:hypothetical protein HYG81_07275 [Natrinema zhouii]|uniref:MarR family transcriptional regulator n=1 Tax=Natrinema zhouii TaxID=1710539 RepID=A0A7D6CQ52_9EURY|nr:hypothetical protein [Natrinema zhouii]QLK27392.1 hypothetical protein HYG81_07275 [Natrinema zhouii]
MSDDEQLKAAIIDVLERDRHTHKSLRQTVSAEHDCSEEAVSQAISALHESGVIEHEQGYFALATDG